jgi:ectoine hydroxylase-related dioxygenase (phytanoyl-CoA dioxygenase family)
VLRSRVMGSTRPSPEARPYAAPVFEFTPQQVAWFETFGFVVLRGWFTDDMARIREGFEEVFAREEAQLLDPDNEFHRTSDPRYQRETRWIIPAFIDRSDKLEWLRTDRRVEAISRALLGDGYLYAESDGNLFNCDVYWHMDAYGATADALHIKLFFYLDELRHEAGALRVIPGSHHSGGYTAALYRQLTKDPERVPEILGVDLDEIPSTTLEVGPGDVIVTNFRTMHGSFNGGARRRLFTVNFRAGSPKPD